jgi:hypothetical protein
MKLLTIAVLLAAFALPLPAHAQGCTQCRDNTASTSPATQRAYRRAILLMSTTAATFFLVTLILFKRNP